MPRYRVEVKETRTYTVEVEAEDEDSAYERAEEDYADSSIADSFDSIERHSVELLTGRD